MAGFSVMAGKSLLKFRRVLAGWYGESREGGAFPDFRVGPPREIRKGNGEALVKDREKESRRGIRIDDIPSKVGKR